MKKVIPLVLITLVLSVAVYSQNGSRGMDNFDRSQGVQVYYPPAPAISFASRSAKKKGTPGSLVSKTGSTRKTASVDDGLATREAYLPARRSLIMGRQEAAPPIGRASLRIRNFRQDQEAGQILIQ